MREVAEHPVWPAGCHLTPPLPNTDNALFPALHFDNNCPRGLLHRMYARHNRLALLREMSRLASEHNPTVARPPPHFISHLHEALGQVTQLKKGGMFDGVIERAGLNELLPFDHNDLFYLLDADESGTVDKREFLAGLAFLLSPSLTRQEQFQLVFEAFDVDNSGALSQEELRSMLQAFGIPTATTSVQETVSREYSAE